MPEERGARESGAAGHWADPLYDWRYGMGVNQKEQYDLRGESPAAVPGEPLNERQAAGSANLFRQQHPWLAPVAQPVINAVEGGLPPWLPFSASSAEIRARERGAASDLLPEAPTPRLFMPPDPAGHTFVPGETDPTTGETGQIQYGVPSSEPFGLNPPDSGNIDFVIPKFLAPTLPDKTPFDAGYEDYQGGMAGSAALDPFAGGDPFGDPTFGSVDPEVDTATYGNREDLPDLTEMQDPTHDSGWNSAGPESFTREEKDIANSNKFDWDSLFGGGYSGGSGGNSGYWEAF